MNMLLRNSLKVKSLANVLRISPISSRFLSLSQKKAKEAEAAKNPEEPIKFFGSGAQSFKTKYTRVGSFDPEEIPWFQPYIVVGSVAIFMIYFCILREENDIDDHLGKSLFEQVPSIEGSTLVTLYKYNVENNVDNTDVIKRLLELGIDPKSL